MKEYPLTKIWCLDDKCEPSVYLCYETEEASGDYILRRKDMSCWIMNPFDKVRLLNEPDSYVLLKTLLT